jgi:hypothetical protein
MSDKIKPIVLDAVLEGASTRKDRSVTLRFSTCELEATEQVVLFRLQQMALTMSLTPQGVTVDAPLEVKGQLEQKTPSQRLRSCLFVLWKYEKESSKCTAEEAKSFDLYYAMKMGSICEWIKGKMPEER